jgi:predicted nucleotidyltransferase
VITVEQHQLIDQVARLLEREANVEAVWLAGSLGAGRGDEFSDVDLVALAKDGLVGEVSARLATIIAGAVQPVLLNSLFGGRVLNVITPDWRRFDLSIIQREELARFDAREVKAVFNKGESEPRTLPQPGYRASPETVLKIVDEFLRVLGLAHVAVGRREWEVALSGIELLRRLTFDLMLEENAVHPAKRGGALYRNPLLTDEQRAEFASLPAAGPGRASIIQGNEAIARIFLPRAKRLAADIGMTWPAAFEEATRRKLLQSLSMRI